MMPNNLSVEPTGVARAVPGVWSECHNLRLCREAQPNACCSSPR